MSSELKTGTMGGMLLGVASQFHLGDVVNTAVMAAVGAVVSFGVSKALQWILRRK